MNSQLALNFPTSLAAVCVLGADQPDSSADDFEKQQPKAEYTVEISNPAKKDLKRLSGDVQKRIIPVLKSLAIQSRPEGVKKLQGSGAYRIRCGDYRIVYDIDDERSQVTILVVRHRSSAYR